MNLLDAVQTRDLNILQDFIAEQDNEGNTALIYACIYNYTDILEFLIKAGANLDLQNAQGYTALMHAALYGFGEIVDILIQAGATVDLRDNTGHTTLLRLVYLHNKTERNKNIPSLLINAGANLNITNDYGYSALMYCITNEQNFEWAKLLMESGADLDIQDSTGKTVLIIAVMNKKVLAVKELIKHQANVHLATTGGNTALMFCFDNIEMIRILLDAGADVNAQNSDGITIMHNVMKEYKLEACKFLFERGANMYLPDKNGITPFYYFNNHLNSLIEFGKNMN